MTYIAKAENGRLSMEPFTKAKFQDALKQHEGKRVAIEFILPESPKLRKFFEGGVVPLVTYYQENLDHHDPEDLRKVRDWLKLEFNAEMVVVHGISKKVPKSSKGRKTLNEFVERVLNWLGENYQPPAESLDPPTYKKWRDTIFPFGGADNYIDHLIEIGLLPKKGATLLK